MIFRGQVFREREETVYGLDLTPKTKVPKKHTRKVLEPVDVELHVNALSVGILGTVAIAGGVAAWLLWDGLAVGTPVGSVQVFRGLKNNAFFHAEGERAKKKFYERRAAKESS